MASQGGADSASAINTPVIKERPTGLQPHMTAPDEKKIEVEIDEGVYEGEFEMNARHGHGIQEWPNGSTYEGQWVNDAASGRGVFYDGFPISHKFSTLSLKSLSTCAKRSSSG